MHTIFLLGLSGSGKSTVGRILAERLGKPLVDIDALIEKECGKRIATIFAQQGEEHFRALETRVLARVATTEQSAVIATGGGIVMQRENLTLMRKHGVCIYLSVDPATALQRLRAQHAMAQVDGISPEIRPLLAGPDPLTNLRNLLTTRAESYEDAHFTCSTEGKSAEQVAQEIIAMLISSDEISGIVPLVRRIQVGQGYDVVVDWGGLGRLGYYLKRLGLPPRIFLITDSNVKQLYGSMLTGTLLAAGFDPSIYTVPAGEASKSPSQLSAIYDWLLEQRAERREAIVALGGGVVGDMAGYAAATYLRGVPLVQVPTSLLAQVDAAIGGKTGINHSRGKNLIGAFYHPHLVLADPATLLTLPVRERTEGWAEVVKYGIILDTKLIALLEENAEILRDFSHPPAQLLCQIIAQCIALKAAIIEEDEREQGRRAILNYGHTVAHALENVAGYGELLHGEAVSIGMVVAAAIAQQAKMFTETGVTRQNRLLKALGLPVTYVGTVQAQDILAAMQLDKKVANKQIHWIMPQRIGNVIVTPLPDDIVQRVIRSFFAEKRL
ncbi:MAG: 3-dehydroquinate synthase [Ktedonobacteraceae bacterium]